ncbi:nucleotidyltransferase [bacterium]|nr:nucleotidyltransferase [bacterium]
MNSKISVFVLAAGMGSRYGGLKQMEGFGPNGETLIDYSIYDAIKAGFDRIVFVIRPDMEEAFKEVFLSKYEEKIDISYCFQTVDMLPSWYKMNSERTKPWGTGHALLVAKDCIHEPFIVINGDDFYGREAFELAAKFLRSKCDESTYAIMGYQLKNVLSDVGTVKRGVCTVSEEGDLKRIDETFDVEKDQNGKINGVTWDGKPMEDLSEKTLVAVNFFCFHRNVLERFEKDFDAFLKENTDEMTGEFLLPIVLSDLVERGEVKVKVVPTNSPWFGVTHKEDAPVVRKRLQELIDQGAYPAKLEL